MITLGPGLLNYTPPSQKNLTGAELLAAARGAPPNIVATFPPASPSPVAQSLADKGASLQGYTAAPYERFDWETPGSYLAQKGQTPAQAAAAARSILGEGPLPNPETIKSLRGQEALDAMRGYASLANGYDERQAIARYLGEQGLGADSTDAELSSALDTYHRAKQFQNQLPKRGITSSLPGKLALGALGAAFPVIGPAIGAGVNFGEGNVLGGLGSIAGGVVGFPGGDTLDPGIPIPYDIFSSDGSAPAAGDFGAPSSSVTGPTQAPYGDNAQVGIPTQGGSAPWEWAGLGGLLGGLAGGGAGGGGAGGAPGAPGGGGSGGAGSGTGGSGTGGGSSGGSGQLPDIPTAAQDMDIFREGGLFGGRYTARDYLRPINRARYFDVTTNPFLSGIF